MRQGVIYIEGGKYIFYTDEIIGSLKCDRFNENWRDFVGDKAVRGLYEYAKELEEKIEQLKTKVRASVDK